MCMVFVLLFIITIQQFCCYKHFGCLRLLYFISAEWFNMKVLMSWWNGSTVMRDVFSLIFPGWGLSWVWVRHLALPPVCMWAGCTWGALRHSQAYRVNEDHTHSFTPNGFILFRDLVMVPVVCGGDWSMRMVTIRRHQGLYSVFQLFSRWSYCTNIGSVETVIHC